MTATVATGLPLLLLQAAPPPNPDAFFLLLQTLPPPVAVLIVAGMLGVTALVLYPLARAMARRLEGSGGGAVRAELESLRERMAELEQGHHRLAELEERVDFSERLLAERREAGEPR